MNKLIYILFVLLSLNTYAQESPYSILKNLHNGALLVRLKTDINLINYLKEQGDTALLNRVQKKRDGENRAIVDAFENNFSFCKIYYFYSNNSNLIKKKEFEGVLLNERLQKTEVEIELNNNYLIAEFSYVRQNKDTVQTWSHSEWGVKDGKAQQIDYYNGSGSKNTINALVLLMPDLRMLPNEYPNYVRTFEKILFFERTKAETVKILQSKILSFEKNINNK
jgi:hypothetical protein